MSDPTHEPNPEDRYCWALKTDGSGDRCRHEKGWGTDHTGVGQCKFHGGSTPNGKTHADREMARERMRTYGAPLDTDPKEALLGEVKRSAGHVAWLSEVVADLAHAGDGYEVIESEGGGKTFIPRSGIKQLGGRPAPSSMSAR